MKQLTFKKASPQGNVDGILRVINKFIYFKYNNTRKSIQIINEFKKKGIKVEEGKGWIRIDLIGDNESIKLKEIIIDTLEDSEEEIEEKLYNFYLNEYKNLGFFIQETNEKSN